MIERETRPEVTAPLLPPDEAPWRGDRVGFLAALSEADRHGLLALGTRLPLRRGTTVFDLGQVPDAAFVLLEGQVRILRPDREGRVLVHGYCSPGELFGLADLFTGTARTVAAEATRPGSALRVAARPLLAFLEDHPRAAVSAMGVLGRRLRPLGGALAAATFDDTARRVARLLLSIADHRPGSAGIATLSFTHQQIADVVGASRPTVTDAIAILRRAGLLTTSGQTILVEPARLRRAMADGAPLASSTEFRTRVADPMSAGGDGPCGATCGRSSAGLDD